MITIRQPNTIAVGSVVARIIISIFWLQKVFKKMLYKLKLKKYTLQMNVTNIQINMLPNQCVYVHS